MRKITLLILSVCASIVGCSREYQFDVPELYLAYEQKVLSLDPAMTSNKSDELAVGNVFEGLFEYHTLKRPYIIIPNLAEAMPSISKDGLIYTFKIRKGVRFADSEIFTDGKGRELTAEDFVYTIKRIADPKIKSAHWSHLKGKIKGLDEWSEGNLALEQSDYTLAVDGLRAIDKYTLVIKLNAVDPLFIYQFASPYTFVVSHEAVASYGKNFSTNPVGTGPFILKELSDEKLLFVKNINFREKLYPTKGSEGDERASYLSDAGKKLPLVDNIHIKNGVSKKDQWSLFKKGRIDYISIDEALQEKVLDSEGKVKLKYRNNGIRVSRSENLELMYLGLNFDNEALRNLKVRQAISLAFNRNEINKEVFAGRAYVAQGVIAPGMSGFRKDFKVGASDYNLEEAKKLLSAAGHSEGRVNLEFTLDIENDARILKISERFSKNMEILGIKVHVSVNSREELLNKVAKKAIQMYAMSWKNSHIDSITFLDRFYCGKKVEEALDQYCNLEVDKLLNELATMTDISERTKKMIRLNEIITSEFPILLGLTTREYYLTQAWIENYKHSEFNYNQSQYLSVDVEIKKELRKKF